MLARLHNKLENEIVVDNLVVYVERKIIENVISNSILRVCLDGRVEKWKDRKLVGGWKYRKIEKI